MIPHPLPVAEPLELRGVGGSVFCEAAVNNRDQPPSLPLRKVVSWCTLHVAGSVNGEESDES